MSAGLGERIDVINGLRGVAILSVIWHHVNILTKPGSHGIFVGDLNFNFLPFALLNNGWLGVNLFFVLSGFVLFLPFAQGRRPLQGAGDIGSFYIRRAKRLLPLFYFSLAVFMLIDYLMTGRISSATHMLLYVTSTFNFNFDTFFPYNNWLLWSLGLEILFSLIFPFLILAERHFSINRLLAITLVLSLGVRYAGNLTPDLNIYLNPVKDSIFGRLDDFVVGMWLCNAYLHPPKKAYPMGGMIAAGLMLLLVVCNLWDYLAIGVLPIGIRPLMNNVFQLSVVLVMVPLLIAQKSFLRALLTGTTIQVIGMMTYSLYVWHGRLIELMTAHANGLSLVIYLITLITISALTYRYIEFWKVRDWRPLFLLPEKKGV